ncbi:MAG: RidA family protein, partial [Proteobacteria bacterium]|nr:RidA family protein [Burkholderiales bacterium]
PAVLRSGRPLDAPPKAQREAQHIFERMAAQLAGAGSAMAQVARLDQYYPHAHAVDPYHVARRHAMDGKVAPSTSIIVGRLLNLDASMDVQVLAATGASGYVAERVPARLNAPASSGYAPCLRVGDTVFVAGQLARDDTGNIAAQARVPAGQLWHGTRITLETRYLFNERLLPALEAAGSAPDLVLKAQVYLSHPDDLPAFLQTWGELFGSRVPPTTIVPVVHPAFGTLDATIEVNLIAAHESARARVRDVHCPVELLGERMLPACTFDNVLFVAGLMAIDAEGLVSEARVHPGAPFFHDSAHAQMSDILAKAKCIFEAAGSDLTQVVRALHFHTDLHDFRGAYAAWRPLIGDTGLPFSAIEVAPQMFVPGARLVVDLWGWAPDR